MTCVPHGLSHYRGKARCRGAHSERARDLDDDGGGAARLFEGLFQARVSIVEVVGRLVHVVTNLVDHHTLELNLIALVHCDALEALNALGDDIQLLVELLVVSLQLLQALGQLRVYLDRRKARLHRHTPDLPLRAGLGAPAPPNARLVALLLQRLALLDVLCDELNHLAVRLELVFRQRVLPFFPRVALFNRHPCLPPQAPLSPHAGFVRAGACTRSGCCGCAGGLRALRRS